MVQHSLFLARRQFRICPPAIVRPPSALRMWWKSPCSMNLEIRTRVNPTATTCIARRMCLCFLKFFPRAKVAMAILAIMKPISNAGEESHSRPPSVDTVSSIGRNAQCTAHSMDVENPSRSVCAYVKNRLCIGAPKLRKKPGNSLLVQLSARCLIATVV